jgi:hypothetical protein
MGKRFQAPLALQLADPAADRVRQSVDQRIRELQGAPAVWMVVVPGVELEDGVETPIAHGLGRAPRWVRESAPRGAASSGRVEQIRGGSFDPSQYVVLKATGWGATITVDVAVM